MSLSAVKVGDTFKWSPGAVIRARHEGVGLSAMWFKIAERQGVEIRYDTAAPCGLLQDRSGRVTGVAAHDPDGLQEIAAKAVVLRLRRVRGQPGVAGALPRPAVGPRQGARHALQHR